MYGVCKLQLVAELSKCLSSHIVDNLRKMTGVKFVFDDSHN